MGVLHGSDEPTRASTPTSPGSGPRPARIPWRSQLLPQPGWVRASWKGLLVVGLLAAVAGTFDAWLATCGFDRCPTAAEIRAFEPAEGGQILDRAGREMARLQAIRRINVPLATVPEHVRQAFVAVEDRRFYEHDGVDLRGAARALARNVAALGVREGFSTITMQAARNTFLSHRFDYTNRSLGRKLIELRIAGLMEQTLTKDEILELYLNVIYLGNGTYGVEAASRDLFGRSVEHVTLAEAAVLAALPKGPSAYTPRRSVERARARRNLVLGLMAREGYITPARADQLRRAPLKLAAPYRWNDGASRSYAADAVRAVVDSVLGARARQYGDLTVHTTLDARAQRAAERSVARHAANIQRHSRRGKEGVEGAMIALDPRSGAVRALVGGREYRPKSFNRALVAKRQPGSAFKPFVYAAALGAGYTPASPVDDTPVEVEQDGRIWRPANYGDEYLGRTTLRRALMRSANAAAVRIARTVGETRVVDVAHANGITSQLDAVPAIALGALEVTPVELVAAYAPFANGGRRVTPHLVRRIEAADGTVLWSAEAGTEPVMDARDAFQLTSMLQSVVDDGTGSTLRRRGISVPVAGKTGTTNNGADVWFVGYTPTIVAGFWFGYDTPRSLGTGAAGGRFAAPAWADFYRDGWNSRDDRQGWTPPDGLVPVMVDAQSGLLADEWCGDAIEEWFKPGTEPTQYATCERTYYPAGDEGEHWLYDVRERIARTLRGIIRFD